MTDTAKALDAIGRLRAIGAGISLDDFGTGHSSLAHLQRLPVDQLKIDRSFVVNMAQNEKDAFIVRSTVSLGRDLGLKIVAEGVEDELTAGLLERLGCDFAQGRFISGPLPSEELMEWLALRQAAPHERQRCRRGPGEGARAGHREQRRCTALGGARNHERRSGSEGRLALSLAGQRLATAGVLPAVATRVAAARAHHPAATLRALDGVFPGVE